MKNGWQKKIQYISMWFLFDSQLLILSFSFIIQLLLSRAEREYVIQEDFMKAVRKVSDNKKLESKLDYKPV